MNILEALDDPAVFGRAIRDPETYAAWRAFLKALFALPMSEAELAIFRECTGRENPPSAPCTEAWLPTGRRGGKSFVLALIATFLATVRDYRPLLSPGERATVMVLAADRKQARVIFRYVKGLLLGSDMLARMIVRETADEIELDNGVVIEIATASHRTTRGYTLAAVLLDEIAFWPTSDDGAESDADIVRALRPGMSTIPGAMLLAASSPYARRGELWKAFHRWYGKDGAPLVWKAPTRTMNPTVPQSEIDAAYEADPASAAAEYGAEFRTDVERLFNAVVVEACVATGAVERPPASGTRYMSFVDPSGGSADSFTLAIAHKRQEKGETSATAVLDAVREFKPPFSPDAVVREMADLLKTYGLHEVTGDRYAGEWPRERFRAHGVSYKLADKTASDLYRDLLPLLNSGRADLLDLPRLTAQLVSLERQTSRTGRDTISHPPRGHDDIANAVAGALVNVVASQPLIITNEMLEASRRWGPRSFAYGPGIRY